MDETTANRIEKILGKQYAGSVRLYRFPIEKCKELKAYKVLEENKKDDTKKLLEMVEVERQRAKHAARDLEVKPFFIHQIENPFILFFNKIWINRRPVIAKPIKESDVSTAASAVPFVPFVPFEPEIDFNALAIVSHKIAEKFARDSGGDFEVGKLQDTELVEFHTYLATHSKRRLGDFAMHDDDKSTVSYKTITMIWYLIKDKEVDGGNIIFYTHPPARDVPPDREVIINLWDQMDDARENCVCLIFKGNMLHSPEPMGGTGERSAIVFQFERIDNPAKRGGKRKNRNRNTRKIKKIIQKKNIKTLKRCSRRAYRAGECYNFQALGCDVLNKPRTALFFKSVREREAYAKSKTGKRALRRCNRLSRYSVVSATRGEKPIAIKS
jgi:hypothetical protein